MLELTSLQTATVTTEKFEPSVHELSLDSDESLPQTPLEGPQITIKTDLDATHIRSSPYDDLPNHLQLGHLDQQSRLMAFALTQLAPTRPDYATAEYMSTFNWSTVFSTLRSSCEQSGIHWRQQDFYVVIFRSQLQRDADRARLGLLDQKSHEEACQSGGLLHYWFGSPDSEMRNLATCLWRNRGDAFAGGKGPWHKKARGAAREMYESISFHTHKLVVEDEARSWRLEEYHG